MESSMAVCVLRNPLQHIPMAVNTAMALPSIHPWVMKPGIRLRAAPTAPRAVIGKATRCGSWNPNSHSNTKSILLASQGSSSTP